MEGRFPIPTDNFYKFLTLVSILGSLACMYGFIHSHNYHNTKAIEVFYEQSALAVLPELTPEQEQHKAFLERRQEVLTSDRRFYNRCLGVLLGVTLGGLMIGLFFWQRHVQALADRWTNAQLQLIDLKAEAMRLDLDEKKARMRLSKGEVDTV